MSDPLLPSDLSEQAVDPVICQECQISENRIEDMQDALSDCLDFLTDLEVVSRTTEFQALDKQTYRTDLLACIKRCKKLG